MTFWAQNRLSRKTDMEYMDLKERTVRFSLQVIALVEKLPDGTSMNVIGRQLLRSATSIGANYHAARRAKSARDFINKLKIVEEEADETVYWLTLIMRSGRIDPATTQNLLTEAGELVAIIVASIKKARGRGKA